jgi:hypothetical protein
MAEQQLLGSGVGPLQQQQQQGQPTLVATPASQALLTLAQCHSQVTGRQQPHLWQPKLKHPMHPQVRGMSTALGQQVPQQWGVPGRASAKQLLCQVQVLSALA